MDFLANDSGTIPNEELYKAPCSAIRKNEALQIIEAPVLLSECLKEEFHFFYLFKTMRFIAFCLS